MVEVRRAKTHRRITVDGNFGATMGSQEKVTTFRRERKATSAKACRTIWKKTRGAVAARTTRHVKKAIALVRPPGYRMPGDVQQPRGSRRCHTDRTRISMQMNLNPKSMTMKIPGMDATSAMTG